MKIFKLSFKNINNLKGENSISFESEPLNSAGIFAITGPTGSGKSTILDVITLALFNKIPRFEKSISKNTIEGMGSVITHHTKNAYARIEYEIRGLKYTSEWITKNTKAGKLVDYDMFIYDAQGKPLDLKKSEVPAHNESIIGLKYDQFVKSIILSQGQFAKFLKAKKDERGQLLENLTGTSIYRKIGIATFQKYREVKNAVLMEKVGLENIICLSDEARKELQDEIINAKKGQEEASEKLVSLNQQQKVKSEIKQFILEIEQVKRDEVRLKSEESLFESQKNKLDIYEKLSPLRGEITRYLDASKSVNILNLEIEKINKELSSAKESYTDSINGMSALTGLEVTPESFSTVMSAFEKEINTLDQEIKHIISKGSEVRDRIELKSSKSNINLGDKPNSAYALPILKEQKSISLTILKAANLDSESNLSEIRLKIKNDSEDLNVLREIEATRSRKLEVDQKLVGCNSKALEYKEAISKYDPLVKTTTALADSIKEKIELLKKQKQDQLLIASFADHRGKLVDGEACPLCGSTHHPWSEHDLENQNDIDQKLNMATQELVATQKELQLHTHQLTTNQASANHNLARKAELELELEKMVLSLTEKINKYQGSESTEPEKMNLSLQIVENRIENLTKAVGAFEDLVLIDDLLLEFETLDNVSKDWKKLDAKRKSKYKGTDVSEDCNRLQNSYVQAKTGIATCSSRLEIAKKSIEEADGIIALNKSKLSPILSSLGYENVESASAQLISESELSSLKSKKEKIQKSKIEISTQLRTLKTQLESSSKYDVEKSLSLEEVLAKISETERIRDQNIKSGAEKSALLKKDDQDQLRLKNKADELNKLNAKLEKWDLLNKMIGDSNGNKFANFAQGLTLQNLLVFANRRLEKLSDRYLLNKPIDDGPLTVVDQYQGNIQRSVNTLSGGESFLISLALALSLSDMASKNVKLESLFIDEGFGTLDQETLEIAMNTLEKLQTESQKTVGVISHVETLKERINVQIKLQKDAMGYSAISVES